MPNLEFLFRASVYGTPHLMTLDFTDFTSEHVAARQGEVLHACATAVVLLLTWLEFEVSGYRMLNR